MRKAILILAILFPTALAFAQAPDTLWSRSYFAGDDAYEGWQVIETHDCCLVVVGATKSAYGGDWDVFLMKTDSDGDTLWTRTYGAFAWDQGRSIKETPDHGFIIAGFTSSFGAGLRDIYLIKTDSLGDTLWTRTYGAAYDEEARSVEMTPDGGYILAGWSNRIPGGEDIYVIKTDSLGNVQWSQTYGDDRAQRGWSITNRSDGGYIAAGWSNIDFEASQIDVLKLNSNGDTVWTRLMGSPGDNEEGRCIIETDGGYVVACNSVDIRGNYWAALIKLNTGGDLVWTNLIAGQSMTNSVIVTRAGSLVATGYGRNPAYYYAFMVKVNASGRQRWLKTFQNTNYDYYLRSVVQAYDGGYVFTGHIGDRAFPYLWLVKLRGDETQDVEDQDNVNPSYISLSPAYPNPFNAQTTIRYSLPKSSNVSIDIFDITGRKIETLLSSHQPAGEHSSVWNAEDKPSGVYFYRLKAGETTQTQRCILLK